MLVQPSTKICSLLFYTFIQKKKEMGNQYFLFFDDNTTYVLLLNFIRIKRFFSEKVYVNGGRKTRLQIESKSYINLNTRLVIYMQIFSCMQANHKSKLNLIDFGLLQYFMYSCKSKRSIYVFITYNLAQHSINISYHSIEIA